jgi:hypothetical protein
MLGIEELKRDHIGCKKVATEHMVVTLGSLPLEYNYCARCVIQVQAELINAGYKPEFSKIERKNT